MGRRCAAINCNSKQSKEISATGITFHIFPKDPKLYKKWIVAMRRDKFTPSKNSSLCSKHFTPECFEQAGWSSRRYIKKEAIPTIFDFPEHVQKNVSPARKAPAIRNDLPVKKSRAKNLPDLEEAGSSNDSIDLEEACTSNDPIDLSCYSDSDIAAGVTSDISEFSDDDDDDDRSLNDLQETSSDMQPSFSGLQLMTKTEERKGIPKSDVLEPSIHHTVQEVDEDENLNNEYLTMEDFTEDDMDDPEKAKKYFLIVHRTLKKQNMKIKQLRQQNRRHGAKINKLMDKVVDHIKDYFIE